MKLPRLKSLATLLKSRSLVARLRAHVQRMGLAYLILLVSFYPATLMIYRVRENVRGREEARLRVATLDLKARIDGQFTDIEHALFGLRGLFLASFEVRAKEWNLFLDSLGFSEGTTGLRDIGFALRVPAADLPRHVEEKKGVGSKYEILPEGNRREYFPITFLRDADDGDVQDLGWDPYANELRRNAMDEARDTGEAVCTPRVLMAKPRAAFSMYGQVVYLPVYRGAVQPATVAERREKLVGFVFGSFRDEALWKNLFAEAQMPTIDVDVFHYEAGGKRVAWDTNPPETKDESDQGGLVIDTGLEYFGQRWLLRTKALPAFADPTEKYFVLYATMGAGVISFTLFLLAAILAKDRAAAQALVERSRRAEAALEAEKERLAVTLRSITDGVITIDSDERVVLMNHAAENLTGWLQGEALSRRVDEVFTILDESTRKPATNPAERALCGSVEAEDARGVILATKESRERLIAVSASAIHDHEKIVGAVLVFRDITEKRRFEAELLKASKLESVGLLAGGIAHDFNNILSIVLGNISLCKMLAPPMGSVTDRLNLAEKGCLRARELTQQLLTFAKGGAPVRKATSINEVVRDSVAFAARGSNIVCKDEVEADLWPVEVDEGQISRVFNNLVINAVQAMPEGGVFKTRMENFVATESCGLALAAGRYVHITAEDNGPGISPEHLPRVFDPYFSTKKEGSGLGLATTYAIIQKHQGCITVESAVGRGTKFHIYLPASETPASRRSIEPEVLPRGGGRVLVMDDEPAILDVARMSLTHLGYEVETAEHGGAAIDKYQTARAAGRPFSAVIMDLTVPGGMGGKEALKHLLEIDPQVRAVVSSGYSHDPVMANFRDYGFRGVVEKPYRIDSLARTLASVIRNQ